MEQLIISTTSRRALGGWWFHLQKDHQIILHLRDLLEIPSPGAGFCSGCFSYWDTAAENIRAESLLWPGAPFLLTLVYVQNRQNSWKVAAKLCSYKTQLSKDTVCRFHACVSVHVTELNTRLWICKRGKTISQEPGFPQSCISITPVPSNAWRRLQSMEASCRTPEPQPHPSGSCRQQRGGLAPARWGGKGGQERQRPLQNWRAWDETLVPRAKEEVRSCNVFSVGSRQLSVDARMKAPYQREQKGDPAVLWGAVVHLPAVVPDYARCNYPKNNYHTWWSGLFVC